MPELGVRYFLDGVLGSGSYDRMPATARAGMLENALEIRAGTASDGYFSPLTREDARCIRKPALLLNGDSSPKMFHLITDELARCLPHVEQVTIPAASHTMHLANPRAFNETVLAFLGGACA